MRSSRYRPQWWKLQSAGAREAVKSYGLDPEFRLWLLAVERAFQGGHANFESGEIQSLVLKLNASSGELSEYSGKQIGRFMSGLIDAGMISSQSTTSCIVLPFELLDSNMRYSPKVCPEHGHDLSWTSEGWIDPTDLVKNKGVANAIRGATRTRSVL